MEKKPMMFLIIAIVAGLAGTAMVGMYVTGSINQRAAELREEYEASKKKDMAALAAQSDQKIAALAQELDRVRTEQAAVVQKQMAEMQANLQNTPGGAKRVKPSLALKTPAGKRAVTVKIDSLGAVGGLINPGDFVDVIGRLRVPYNAAAANSDGGRKLVTAVIFQGLEVLAVNTNLSETGAYYDEQQNSSALKVTVAVAPEEAGFLTFADKNGTLELALRSPQETERQMVKATTWKTLADYVLQNQGADIELPDDLSGRSPTQQPEKPEIQIFRGGKEL